MTLQWRHNGHDSVSNHQPDDCVLNRLFRRRSKKTTKLRVTGLCAGNSPGTSEFPSQMASNAENVSIWWRHHELQQCHIIGWVVMYLISLADWSFVQLSSWVQKKESNEKMYYCFFCKATWFSALMVSDVDMFFMKFCHHDFTGCRNDASIYISHHWFR